jgi:aryl-alcohol dehydrogenase-like predicted oxidoreductase
LKKAYDLGITSWDAANTYSNDETERIIGKALQKYAFPREKVVIMTNFYYAVFADDPNARSSSQDPHSPELVNQMGLSPKHIWAAVEASLARLRTSHVNVPQMHILDRDAQPHVVIRALHDLVTAGKVHFVVGSSMHTWRFARLQFTAKMDQWTTFSSMQELYNSQYREKEREMKSFCQAEGIGLIPWNPLARGLLSRPYGVQSARGEEDEKMKKWFGRWRSRIAGSSLLQRI